jgi:hypothetical protein
MIVRYDFSKGVDCRSRMQRRSNIRIDHWATLFSFACNRRSLHPLRTLMEDLNMKLRIGIAAAAMLATGFVTAMPEPASAVMYCTYVGYPAGCVGRPGVVLRARPVARAAVRPGTPMNRGGPVNRVGRR